MVLSRYAIVFPGQGSQFVGMGKNILENSKVADDTFARAERITGIPLRKLCLEGPAAELDLTINAQLTIFLLEAVLYDSFASSVSIKPIATAGHSLGEYAALYAAGAFDLESAMRIVYARAQRHQNAVPAGVGAMLAVVGIGFDDVQKVCIEVSYKNFIAEIANINSDRQIVISGHKSALTEVSRIIQNDYFARTVFLPVSVPCHSSLMQNAAELFATDIDGLSISTPRMPVIANCDPSQCHSSKMTKTLLKMQMVSPVQWSDCMKQLIASGVDTIIEIGAKKVLIPMLGRGNRQLKSFYIGDTQSLSDTLQQL